MTNATKPGSLRSMKLLTLCSLLGALAITGCVGQETVTIRPTGVHSVDATRTWWVIRDESGRDALAMCEPGNVKLYGYACVRMTP
jgi:hypothetical protein